MSLDIFGEDLAIACPICGALPQTHCLSDDGVPLPGAIHGGRLSGGESFIVQRVGEDLEGNGIFVQVVPLSVDVLALDGSEAGSP